MVGAGSTLGVSRWPGVTSAPSVMSLLMGSGEGWSGFCGVAAYGNFSTGVAVCGNSATDPPPSSLGQKRLLSERVEGLPRDVLAFGGPHTLTARATEGHDSNGSRHHVRRLVSATR